MPPKKNQQRKPTNRRPTFDYSQDDPEQDFPELPDDYEFENRSTQPEVESLAKSDSEPELDAAVPDTRAHFDKCGSITQPPVGYTSKPPDGSCLTCIQSRQKCHGTSIWTDDKGKVKCKNCRGKHPDDDSDPDPVLDKSKGEKRAKSRRQVRVCRWKQPEKNVYTYSQWGKANGARVIKGNRTVIKVREIKLSQAADKAQIQHFPRRSIEWDLVQWIATGLWDLEAVTDDEVLNRERLIELTQRRISSMIEGRMQGPADPRVREQTVMALNEIYARLVYMRGAGIGISRRQIRMWLIDDHRDKLADTDA